MTAVEYGTARFEINDLVHARYNGSIRNLDAKPLGSILR